MADIIGLRVRDPNTGLITVDLQDRLTRYIGTFNTGAGPGSIVVPSTAEGIVWAAVMVARQPDLNILYDWRYPRLTISGYTISWDFPGSPNDAAIPCDIAYGVY